MRFSLGTAVAIVVVFSGVPSVVACGSWGTVKTSKIASFVVMVCVCLVFVVTVIEETGVISISTAALRLSLEIVTSEEFGFPAIVVFTVVCRGHLVLFQSSFVKSCVVLDHCMLWFSKQEVKRSGIVRKQAEGLSLIIVAFTQQKKNKN